MSTKKAPSGSKKHKKNAPTASRGPYSPAKGSQKPAYGRQNTDRVRAPKAHLKAPANSYFLWGGHALEAALANSHRVIKALYCTNEAHSRLREMIQKTPASRLAALPDIQIVERALLDSVPAEGGKAVHQGMIAAVMPLQSPYLEDYLDDLPPHKPLRFLMLDQVSDPRNIGAMLRSARAFGVSALIMQDRNAPEETGALARTAVGALEEIDLIRVVNLARACDALKEAGFHLVGLDMDGHFDSAPAAREERLCLIMGSEGKGMRRLTREACDDIIAIKMADSSESLNVSVAAAIIMHQTQFKDDGTA